MVNKLKVAVIGAGNMGGNHLRNYAKRDDVKVVGVSDINPSASDLAKEHGAKYYVDYKAMIEAERPDAVSIVVPTPLHYEIASFVLEKGIHCLLEKPIASTVEEARQLIDLADEKKVVFTVGHIEHYNPLIRELRKILQSGVVGDITSIVCKRVGGFPVREPKTDVVLDLAIHDIGIINYLLGKSPEAVYSHTSKTHHTKESDSAEILLDYGEQSGFVQANWLTPVKIRTIAATGSKGYIEGNYITQELEYYEHNLTKKPQVHDNFHEFIFNMGEPKRSLIKVDFEEPLAVEIGAFILAIKGEDSELVTGAEALEALRIALLAQ